MVTTQSANDFAERRGLPRVRSREEVRKGVKAERFKLNQIPGSVTVEERDIRRKAIRESPFPWPGVAARMDVTRGHEQPTSAGIVNNNSCFSLFSVKQSTS